MVETGRGAEALAKEKDQVQENRPSAWQSAENGMIWTLWLTYGAFYFCRTNISAALPGMKADVATGGLGLTGAEVGWILASLKLAYAMGQLLNGQLSERISPRVMLAIGMFGSAALNICFGLSTGFYFLLFIWAANGFCQSLGWTPCVRVAANWVPIQRRGRAMGIIGTGYQITLGLTYLISASAAENFGWRGAFYLPAALLAATGVFMLVFLKESPPDEEDAETGVEKSSVKKKSSVSFTEGLYWTLYNPALWLMGLSLGLLNACRYGFLDWGIVHLMETQNISVGSAGIKFFVIAIGAAAGSYLTGWATDRFFGSRRAPMICMLMVLLGVVTLGYDWVVQHSVVGTLFLLVVIGFCIYGPQVLLVGTAPADLAHRGTSAAAAGFVNFMGYLGAASGDVLTGYFSAEAHGGWQTAIYLWAGWAFLGAVITAILWNTTSRKVGLVPRFLPKFMMIAALLIASVSLTVSPESDILTWGTYLATVFAVIAVVQRWAAVPGLSIAVVGGLFIFISHLATRSDITWQQTVAVLSFGMTIISGLMILVEREDERICA